MIDLTIRPDPSSAIALTADADGHWGYDDGVRQVLDYCPDQPSRRRLIWICAVVGMAVAAMGLFFVILQPVASPSLPAAPTQFIQDVMPDPDVPDAPASQPTTRPSTQAPAMMSAGQKLFEQIPQTKPSDSEFPFNASAALPGKSF